MPSNHLILCQPLLLLPSIFPSISVFSNESVLRIRWPKYWSFTFSFSPSNEYSGLISFRMDWLDLLAVQGTLKSLLQHHNSKASILCHHLEHCQLSWLRKIGLWRVLQPSTYTLLSLKVTNIDSLYNLLTSIYFMASPTIKEPGIAVIREPSWKTEAIWQTAAMTNIFISVLSC